MLASTSIVMRRLTLNGNATNTSGRKDTTGLSIWKTSSHFNMRIRDEQMTTEARRITEKILNGEELTDDEKFTTEEVIAGLKIIAKLGTRVGD